MTDQPTTPCDLEREEGGSDSVSALGRSGEGPTASPPDGPAHDLRTKLLSMVGGQEAFERSFNARTHYPEKAASQALDGAIEYWLRGNATLAAIEAPAEMVAQWRERFVSKWLAYQSAGARTMNWFITGPARFPVERNRKRMETEMRRYDELMLHVDEAASWARRRMASDERAHASAEAQAAGAVNAREINGVRLVENTATTYASMADAGYQCKPAALAERIYTAARALLPVAEGG